VKPPITYYGGKTGMAPLIASLLPPHRSYIEPFFGSGAVLFAKEPSTHEIVNDLDRAVVAFFRCLRDQPKELDQLCSLTPYARAEYEAANLDVPDLEDLELARRFWARVNLSFSKSTGRSTGFSVTTARTQAPPNSVNGRRSRFADCAARLAGVTIESCDAVDLIERLATPETAMYVDPPYIATARTSRGPGTMPTDYGCDMGGAEDHQRLIDCLLSTPAAVLLSGYRSDLYDDALASWDRIEIHTHAHGSNSRTVERSQRIEVIWSNRTLEIAEQGNLFAEATA